MSDILVCIVFGIGYVLFLCFYFGGSGLIVVIKDCIDIVGQFICGGSVVLVDVLLVVVYVDVVCKLFDVGWQLIVCVNMYELVYGMIGINDWNGIVVNLQDVSCMIGGFFSGLVLVVGVGLVDMFIGSDIGGLICLFVVCCGVIGFKLSFGCVSCVGVYLVVSSLDCVGFFVCSMDFIISVMVSIVFGFDCVVVIVVVVQVCVKLVMVQVDFEIVEVVVVVFVISGW